VNLRALLLAAAGTVLWGVAGCALVTGAIGLGEPPKDAQMTCQPDAPPLQRWDSIAGTLLARPGRVVEEERIGSIRLVMPVAAVASGNETFIADAATSRIIRFDNATKTVRSAFSVPGMSEATRLFIDRALSLYVVNPAIASAIEFDIDGRPVRRFEGPPLQRPTALVVDQDRARVLIADDVSARIVAMDSAGNFVDVFGFGGTEAQTFGSISALAVGPDQLYVVDRIRRRVHFLALDGTYRYDFGAQVLENPGAIAVDGYNRVYVADDAEAAIEVFQGGEHVTTITSGSDPRAPRFQRVASLWASEGFVYLADPMSASVEVLRVVPPCTP